MVVNLNRLVVGILLFVLALGAFVLSLFAPGLEKYLGGAPAWLLASAFHLLAAAALLVIVASLAGTKSLLIGCLIGALIYLLVGLGLSWDYVSPLGGAFWDNITRPEVLWRILTWPYEVLGALLRR